MENRIQYKINVSGRVQGVGFRWSAAREAGILGIAGFVKNMPDGNVYIEAEGTRDQLDSFVGWCKMSPGLSEVKSVTVEQCPVSGYRDFRIEH